MNDLMGKIKNLKEGFELEFKTATSSFPKSALNTYSAMANTDGGLIVFGIEEQQGEILNIPGVTNAHKLKKTT